MKKMLTVLTSLALVLTLAGAALAQGLFVPLPVSPGFFPGQLDVNYDGSVVGGSWGGIFYYTQTDGLQMVDTTDQGFVGFWGITGDGTTLSVTFPNANGEEQAGYYNADEGFVHIASSADGVPCGGLSSGYGLSHDGTMGTGLQWIDGCQARAYRWTKGGDTVTLGSSGNSSRGTGISGDGTVIVGFDEHPTMGFRRAAIWTEDVEGPQLITPEDDPSECYAASSDGSKICGVWNQAAMYYDAVVGPISLGTLPGDEGFGANAFDISDDGIVVGQSGSPFFGVPRGFVWTPADGMMTCVDFLIQEGVDIPDGLNVYTVSSISGDGRTLTGAFVNQDFFLEAFVVYLDGAVGIENPVDEEVAEDDTPAVNTALLGAYPNPFNPMTTVKFNLDSSQNVKLSVYDMSGRLVRELANQHYSAGEHSVVWQGRDSAGRAMSSGNYILHMITKQGVETSKMSLVR